MSDVTVVPADGYAGDLSPADTWELLSTDPRAVLVDVRTQDEWEQIGVPDVATAGKRTVFAQWVLRDGRPNPEFLAQLRAGLAESGAGADAPVVFLCRSGQRSVGAARLATQSGIAPSFNVLEGFEGAPGPDGVRDREGWKVAGLPWRTTFADGAPAGDAR
ncbi:rhodanese-like domain-containing protein [Xylanimonas allomyrinae]|uniref:Rhodanese-like domain-containing protein n=1 Tax=Xylanimonas allomyrinae TaxID=2509459 RepID=A0A4P6EQS3_9MICO|nr:rhodanese-like domain-containing protein [Xylanimonas allomyrinae]QAY63789.1 rhodanese-like domain-containing protein [Xylanimonas allomyrinae]